jgi:hypothetical protein
VPVRTRLILAAVFATAYQGPRVDLSVSPHPWPRDSVALRRQRALPAGLGCWYLEAKVLDSTDGIMRGVGGSRIILELKEAPLDTVRSTVVMDAIRLSGPSHLDPVVWGPLKGNDSLLIRALSGGIEGIDIHARIRRDSLVGTVFSYTDAGDPMRVAARIRGSRRPCPKV